MNEREKHNRENRRNLKIRLQHLLHGEGGEGNVVENAVIDELEKGRVEDIARHFVKSIWHNAVIANDVATLGQRLFNVGSREETVLLQFLYSDCRTLPFIDECKTTLDPFISLKSGINERRDLASTGLFSSYNKSENKCPTSK